MFAIISNGVIAMLIPAGTAFEWDGVQYPANWTNLSSPEEKAAIGMVDVVYGQYPNDQYYWVSQDAPVYNGTVVEINYTATPKDLATCQTSAVSAVNAQAYSQLQPTDWLVIRSTESGGVYPVPATWNTWRQQIRTQASNAATAINACTTVDQLAALPPVDWAPQPTTLPAEVAPTVTP
jgi:hypothetical protein